MTSVIFKKNRCQLHILLARNRKNIKLVLKMVHKLFGEHLADLGDLSKKFLDEFLCTCDILMITVFISNSDNEHMRLIVRLWKPTSIVSITFPKLAILLSSPYQLPDKSDLWFDGWFPITLETFALVGHFTCSQYITRIQAIQRISHKSNKV